MLLCKISSGVLVVSLTAKKKVDHCQLRATSYKYKLASERGGAFLPSEEGHADRRNTLFPNLIASSAFLLKNIFHSHGLSEYL